jgi:hypothetical protein
MGSWAHKDHPHLNETNHDLTSECTTSYNCIAWAMGEDDAWWWPSDESYWPNDDRGSTLGTFERMLTSRGFARCANGALVSGVEKVVIYTLGEGRTMKVTHAARQLPDGRWASKMGRCEDIEHDAPKAVRGPVYGKPYAFYCRPAPEAA